VNNADMPAMPTIAQHGDLMIDSSGLTKREHFAAMAMQGLLASETIATFEEFAGSSVQMADALLAELERTQQNQGERL
jgi:DNA-binding CsgD family transcriptional regulator